MKFLRFQRLHQEVTETVANSEGGVRSLWWDCLHKLYRKLEMWVA